MQGREADANVYIEIGKLVRARRLQLAWTQERLAKLLSLSRASVANIENGRQKLLVHTLLEFAAALQMDAVDLLPKVIGPESIKNLDRFNEVDRNFLATTLEGGKEGAEPSWLSDEER